MKGKPAWVSKKREKCSRGMGAGDLNKIKQHYAGMITLIDDWIGKMLKILDERGLRENTAIIFCTDHGEMLGEHGLFTKSCMYEGALRVPFIIAYPGAKGGCINSGLAENVDLFPTILDMAKINYDRTGLDGESLLPVIKNGEKVKRDFQFSELANTRMIFDGRYKFIENHNDINELYDLQTDPGELNNILAENAPIAQELLVKMRSIRK
jgi:choline-sulfatase